MAQPVIGLTDFNNIPTTFLAAATSASAGLTAFNVDGWDFTLKGAGASATILAAPLSGSSAIYGQPTSGLPAASFVVSSNNSYRFSLTSVDLAPYSASSVNGGMIRLIGYRNGTVVPGAELDQTVNDIALSPGLATFDVHLNAAFQNIDAFAVQTDGSFSVNGGLVVDNIVVAGLVPPPAPPVVAVSSGSAGFVAGNNAPSTPVAIDPGLTVADPSSATLASATVSLTGNFRPGEDRLGFVNNGATQGNIGASYNSASGVLSLASAGATATLAQWQAALRAVTYTDTAVTPNVLPRTVTIAVNDGNSFSTAITRNVTVAATDQSPIVTTTLGSTTISAAAAPVPVDSGVTVTDLDNPTLASATVSITANFRTGEDVLAFSNTGQGNIAGSYNPANGVLSLNSAGATATVAQWQSALRAVTYADTAASPTAGARTVSFAVNDGAVGSALAAHTVSVAFGSQPGNTSPAITPGTIGLFRFFDTKTGTQFFAASQAEASAITDPSSPGYQPRLVAETNGFGAFSQSAADPAQIAVYRFFDKANGAHFFTASAIERDALTNPNSSDFQASFVAEPAATFYEHATQQAGDIAVYRLFDSARGTHFYTSSAAELSGLTTRGGSGYQPTMVSEGIAFYAPTTSTLAA